MPAPGAAGTVEPLRPSVYFAFVDGLLDYQCATCDQRCCKGAGFAVDEIQREALVQLRPGLRLFLKNAGHERHSRVANFDPGCWFLDRGRCGLYETDVRPTACNAFPFNVFGRIDSTITVAPHPLCPLELSPALEGRRHEEILSTLGEPEVPESGRMAGVSLPESAAPLTLERALRDRGVAFLDRPCAEYFALALDATDAYRGGRLDDETAVETPSPEALDLLERRWHRWQGWFDARGTAMLEASAVRPELIAFSPALRLNVLRSDLSRIPIESLALEFLLRLEDRLRARSDPGPRQKTSLKNIVEIVASLEPLLWLMTHAEDRPRLKDGPALLDGAAVDPGHATTLERQLKRIETGATRLAEVFEEVDPGATLERMMSWGKSASYLSRVVRFSPLSLERRS